MALRNSEASFGLVTRALHWLTALSVLIALPLGVWIAEMQVSLASIKYFGIHKSIGFTVLVLTTFRIVWHLASPPPEILQHGGWQDRAAKVVHRLFYVCLILMPISGWFASSASGIDTVLFNAWTLPRIAPVSADVEAMGFAVHRCIGWVIAALIAAHVAGAIYRGFVKKDRTFARMLRG